MADDEDEPGDDNSPGDGADDSNPPRRRGRPGARCAGYRRRRPDPRRTDRPSRRARRRRSRRPPGRARRAGRTRRACDPDNCPDADAELDKASATADLARLADAALADLAKALPRVEALERRLDAQADVIERLAATPAPPRTAASPHARAIGKAEDADPAAADAGDLSAAEAQKAFAVLTPDERAFLLMKASLRRPIPLP